MPANLTQQYLKAEEAYRRATSPEDELQALQDMLRELPKHKGTEKLYSELKKKISRCREQIQGGKSGGKKRPGVQIQRQGAGTAILLGPPNSGKSQLLAALTRAEPEVAPYPFTTRTPQPGMMPWEDVYVQLVDSPPITNDFFEPYMHGLIRSADATVVVADLGTDEGIEQAGETLERVQATKSRLGRETHLDDEDIGVTYTQTLWAWNKIDVPDARDRLELARELLDIPFPEFLISAQGGDGLPELRDAIYRALDVIRVYTKLPTAKEADYEKPFTLRRGGTVIDLAELIHKDLVATFKSARIWGAGVHDGTSVKGDHVLEDQNVVEVHAS